MAAKYLQTLKDWSGGLNDKDADNLIQDNQVTEITNGIIGRGFISKRHGFRNVTTGFLFSPITKLYDFFRNNGTTESLAVISTGLYKWVGTNLTPVTGSLTSSTVQCLTYKDRSIADVVLFADQGKLKAYNGTDVAEVTAYAPTVDEQTDPGSNDLANLTNFRALAIKKDRIFAAAHPTVKNRVSFCHHDPDKGYAVYDYWPATFFFDVAASENDEIVQLQVFRDALVILCKRTLWVLYGDGVTLQDYELHRINVPSGCIAPNSVTIVGNDLFYLSDDHIYALYATQENYVSASIVSEKVENTLKSIPRSDKEKAVGTFFDNKYYLSFPSGLTLVYDTLLKAWMQWTNIKANSFLDRDGVLFFASDQIYEFAEGTYNDAGEAIPFSFKTKIFDLGKHVQLKKWRRGWIVFNQESSVNITLNMIVDYLTKKTATFETATMGWDVATWDESTFDDAAVTIQEFRIKEKGYNMQFELVNNELNQPVTLYAISFEYKLKRP